MNSENPPVGGGARGWIQNSTTLARLCFDFWPRNRGKCTLQAAHTDTFCNFFRLLPPTGISSAVFFAYASLTSSANRKTKKPPIGTRFRLSVIFRNVRLKMSEQTTWWHCSRKKRATCFYVPYRSTYKKIARCGSILQDTCVLIKLELFSTHL